MDTKYFEQQLVTILDDYKAFKNRSKYSDLCDLPDIDIQSLVTLTVSG